MLNKLGALYRFSNSWTGTIIIVLLVIFFLVQAFVIPSGSMKNTLLIGDYLLVKKYSYGIPIPHIPWLEIRRGDIVVFRYPENPKIHYVKRCVALGGDVVMVRNKILYIMPKEGNEYVKSHYLPDQIVPTEEGLWVREPYRYQHPGVHNDPRINYDTFPFAERLFDFGPKRVPEGHYFMMGDNRDHSNDSRSWGSVPYENIVGKPWRIYFSWESRSWEEVMGTSEFDRDVPALLAVCPSGDFYTDSCRDAWERHRYTIRWDRVGETAEALEKRL